MALYRFGNEQSPYYVELGWNGVSNRNQVIPVVLSAKNELGEFVCVEELGSFTYESAAAQAGYVFHSPKAGDVVVKWIRKFLIFEKIEVRINGVEAKGSEILRLTSFLVKGDMGNIGKHV